MTDVAMDDLAELPERVETTFMNEKGNAERNLELGADPSQALGKYLSGAMHPIIQMNLGRNYRAWFVEGRYLEYGEDDAVYAVRVLEKKTAKKLTRQIPDALAYAESLLE